VWTFYSLIHLWKVEAATVGQRLDFMMALFLLR
jgi:hypothetical protein